MPGFPATGRSRSRLLTQDGGAAACGVLSIDREGCPCFASAILIASVAMSSRKHLPLVYSCSGCSSAAQMANHLAIALDRRGLAEMSCIAGVGGDVPKLVRIAKSGRRIIGIDGCALACVRNCLARHGVEPDEYHLLSDQGVRKRYQTDFDPAEADRVLDEIAAALEPVPADPA